MNQLNLPAHLRALLGADPFADLMQMQGKVFRDVRGRKTIQVTLGGQSYFIKQHFGVGWGEIFKSYLSLKKPVVSAITEVQAIQTLNNIGIPTTPLVAYGQRGRSPATMQSFIMTQDLGEIADAEALSQNWVHLSVDFKEQLIKAIALLASRFHQAGLCHRDFYLCHFVVKKAELAQGQFNLHVIDLHRVLHAQSPNGTSVMKDIAGLFFSATQAGWGADDLARFKQHYLAQSDAFWTQVEVRSQALLAKFNSQKFQARLAADREKLG